MIKTANRLHTVSEYYFSKKLKEVRQLAAQGKPIINMGIGSPDLDPPETVIKALQEAVSDPGAHQYQSYQGLPELRQEMVNFYKKYFNTSLDSNTEVLPLMGSKEGIMHISMAFLNKGDEVLIPNPGYPTYTSVTHMVEAVPRYYDLTEKNNWLPDLKELEKQDLSKSKLIWVNYPHMPTGIKGDKVLFKELIAFAKKHQILIVNDNPYSFILNDTPMSLLSIEGSKEVAIELNSLSKTFNMAGWRVGAVLGKEEYINAILKVKSNMDSGMFYGIQKGAIEAFKSSEEWFKNLKNIYNERRELIFQLADKLNCTYDKNTAGMFVWGKLPIEAGSSQEFIDAVLYNKSVFIAPGNIFGSNGEGYIRFSLCVDKEKIKEVIKRF
ncbi:pyridoxal phosphate-dependent aminotransferase [Leptobacterium sp. I13]|uniref:pyridoxal phosphate-dependent aminotransferase n=1 Tax=Leptobacterium meishanense TaxID=3128904 RepID=UPI0030ED0396